ncbi:MAG: futalosine hydrolase [Planctomycetota bacterium]
MVPRVLALLPPQHPAGRAPRLLLVVAAPGEALAVSRAFGKPPPGEDWQLVQLAPRVDLIRTGVGKANAAGGTGAFLARKEHGAVLNLGVAGTYADSVGTPRLAIGSVLVASRHLLADEGVQTPDGFVPLSTVGFATGLAGDSVEADPAMLAALAATGWPQAPIATVSACSGTNAQAARIAASTGAWAEAMEGAGVALVAARLGVHYAEVRVISNTTGDREHQRWDLGAALSRLTEICSVRHDR